MNNNASDILRILDALYVQQPSPCADDIAMALLQRVMMSWNTRRFMGVCGTEDPDLETHKILAALPLQHMGLAPIMMAYIMTDDHNEPIGRERRRIATWLAGQLLQSKSSGVPN